LGTRNFDWYSFHDILSRNAVYNFVVGGRGLGKTYGAKKLVIKKALEKGEEFIYLRRHQTELRTKDTFFNDVGAEFPDCTFRVNGLEAQVSFTGDDWKTIGYFHVLSKAQTYKSGSYPLVKTIIFDEFILEKGYSRYLPDETNAMASFYSTVDRYRDEVRVLFLANSVSIMNPYFTEYGINPDREMATYQNGFIAVHFPKAEKFRGQVSETRFGRFIKDTGYGNYAMGNEFVDNHKALLGSKLESSAYAYTIVTKSGDVSLWCDMDSYPREWYATRKAPARPTYVVMDHELMGDGRILLGYSDKLIQRARTAYARGRMVFEDATLRNIFGRVFKR